MADNMMYTINSSLNKAPKSFPIGQTIEGVTIKLPYWFGQTRIPLQPNKSKEPPMIELGGE